MNTTIIELVGNTKESDEGPTYAEKSSFPPVGSGAVTKRVV